MYGDSFTREGSAVTGIGNNVTLTWENMDFGERGEVMLCIDGRTPLETNAVSIRIENENGDSENSLAEFRGTEREEQRFTVQTPGGVCRVNFVFLPGCQFDFYGFRFLKE